MGEVVEIRALGPFAMRGVDGARLAMRKAQGLLAYLAVEGRASRDGVATLLWGDRGEDRARHNLRQALSKIRSVCGPIVESQGDLLWLDADACATDVTEFLQLADADDKASLTRCLDLYAGDLLEGLLPKEPEFERWLLQARERLRHAACDAMDRYVQLLISDAEYEPALALLNRRLAMDPACEPAHRNLMTIFASTGRRSEALRQYRRCVDALMRELGVEPGADTRRLFEQLRDADQSTPASRAANAESETPRVAVLPFDNLSGERDAYFVDGIAEDIITALSRFHALHVIARGSTFHYKGKNTPDAEIAAALGAKYLVRGSVLRSDDRIRLNVQLLDGSRGVTIWGDRFDLPISDVFRVQDEITATVVSTLAGRVEASQIERARKASRQRLEAYDYLLRGKDHHHRFTADDCALCIDLFGQAIDRDADYAVAHAWLACGLGQAMVWGLDDNASLVDRAQAAAERGLELDENESECHRILAQVHLSRGDLSRALKHQERALFLNPNDDRSVCAMGEILAFCGRHEEAEQWVRKSMTLNPYHPQRYWTHLARALLHLGRPAEALEVLEQIGRPRKDDLAYAVVAAVGVADEDRIGRNVAALRLDFPDFAVAEFVASLRYQRQEDRDLISGGLTRAGL